MQRFTLFLFIKDITLDGGAERVVVNMANKFAEIYESVHIVSRYKKNLKINYDLNSQVQVHYLQPHVQYDTWKWRLNSLTRLLGNYLYSLGFTPKLYRVIDKCTAKGNKAIVLLNGYEIPFYKRENTFLLGVDHSCFPYLTEKRKKSTCIHRIYSILERLITRNLDIVTCLTDSQMEDWNSLGKPVYVMPNFIGTVPDNLLTYVSREKVVLSMGRMMDEQKGFDRLIIIFSKIANQFPDWKLRILGNGPLKQQYMDLIKKLKAESYIELLDYTCFPEKEYQVASIYAMASRWEGFGMVLIEAMANGLPVIAYDVPFGPAFIIKDALTGSVIFDGDEAAFCSKLKNLMTDYELREEMGRRARADVINRFSASVIMSNWVKLFESLVKL